MRLLGCPPILDGPRAPQTRSQTARDASKRVPHIALRRAPRRANRRPRRPTRAQKTTPTALQERPEWPRRELHMVPDGPRAINNTDDDLQTATEALKTPQEASTMRHKRASRRTKTPVPFVKRIYVSHMRLLGCSPLLGGPRAPQDRTKTVQEASTRAPRQPKRAPRRVKRGRGRPKRAPKTARATRGQIPRNLRRFPPCSSLASAGRFGGSLTMA